ncbi:MAG: ECF transporter S component [Clostridia bacterium]|nr:ECF transporter S component [Clostridia bacterium]
MVNKTKKIVFSALLASLVCVATMVIKIPSPLSGYINLGDGVVLLCGWFLGPVYGFLAAAVGSALADLFYGYMVYVPATFLIKGAVALIACVLSKKTKKIISAIVAEAVMVAGYYVFEGFLYGFGASLVNVAPNIVQATAGIVVGLLLMGVFKKTNIEF